MEPNERIIFTKQMKKDYTILIPTMLPRHFKMLVGLLRIYGYKMELLENTGNEVIQNGLKYVHNDTCYPAQIVIGQFIDALNSGKYDTHKTALMFSQTGGGCRASNYIALLRKALKKAGYGYIPVISFNVMGMEKNPGFKLSVPMLRRMMYAVIYGDVLMLLANQTKPYEIHDGDTERMADVWTTRLTEQLGRSGTLSYRTVKKTYKRIVSDFASIPMIDEDKVKVGIVGEIYVKFSPLANRDLEAFLVSEGAESSMAGLLDFALYYIYGRIVENEMYRKFGSFEFAFKIAYRIICKKQNDIIEAIESGSDFMAPTPFDHTVALAKEYISLGVKMGEGWLLVAEMAELMDKGINNIVCAQPFGCLPNHIVGKGVMKIMKERNPDVNIVPIDYDASASEINQQNRIKLLLANAKAYQERKKA